jgi:adenylosuccinate lyase
MLIREGLVGLLNALKTRALEHRHTPMVGRSHGIHAEPITFGLKLAVLYSEMFRHLTRWDAALKTISVGKISGAVGTFAHLDPQMEEDILAKLGLEPALASSQVRFRGIATQSISRLGHDGLKYGENRGRDKAPQRSEVAEAEEFFHEGQKGSSAMLQAESCAHREYHRPGSCGPRSCSSSNGERASLA